MRKLWGLELNW